MDVSDKPKTGKEQPPQENKMMESKPTEEPSEDIQIPEDMLVKFNYCVCGALLDSSDTECWSCGKKLPIKGQSQPNPVKNEEKKPVQESSQITEKETQSNKQELPNKKENQSEEPTTHYARFINCPKCGCLNEIYSAETICWSCNHIMDTSASFKELTKSLTSTEADSQHKLESAADKAQKSGKPVVSEKKKVTTKYVIHCTKCNSWFVTNEYSFAMQCTSCGKKNVLYVSYTCENCKKFFDLNQNKKEKCPYCKKSLVLTNETALY